MRKAIMLFGTFLVCCALVVAVDAWVLEYCEKKQGQILESGIFYFNEEMEVSSYECIYTLDFTAIDQWLEQYRQDGGFNTIEEAEHNALWVFLNTLYGSGPPVKDTIPKKTNSSFFAPLTTWNPHAEEIALELYGENASILWACNESYMYGKVPGQLQGNITYDEYGYLGRPEISGEDIIGYSVHFECEDIVTPTRLLYFEIDPNNGFIKRLACNSQVFNNCPIDNTGENVCNGTNYLCIDKWFTENPDYETYLNLQ